MYAFPQLIAVPALTGVGAMAIEWPTIGAFLAWTLFAALVGTGLGALRRLASPPPPVAHPYPVQPAVFQVPTNLHADRNHRQAA